MTKKIIRLPIVKNRTGYSRSSIYAGIADGSFPAQIPLGARAVGWVEDEINAWVERRVAKAQGHASMHINKAAVEIGIPSEELQPFIDSGELPTYRLGRHRLVKKTALAAFQQNRQTAETHIKKIT
jgi:prophage regulatory protein